MLYATDFHNGRVDVFDEHFHQILRHRFVDPSLPNDYAPFGIQTIGSAVFVTYAKQDPNSDDELHGAHFGYVDMYSLRGRLLARVASRHALNAPWGLAWAPDTFGRFSGDLLVGNFGDGRINAYAWSSGHFHWAGVLHDGMGAPISIDGLWALEFGNGGPSGPTTTLFFTAGPERRGSRVVRNDRRDTGLLIEAVEAPSRGRHPRQLCGADRGCAARRFRASSLEPLALDLRFGGRSRWPRDVRVSHDFRLTVA